MRRSDIDEPRGSRISLPITVEEALRPMTSAKFGALRKMFAAHRHCMWTARVKATASRWINEAGNLATCRESHAALSAWSQSIRIRRSGDEQLCVRMPWPLYYILTGSSLHRLSSIHDKRIFGEIASAGNVMGNE